MRTRMRICVCVNAQMTRTRLSTRHVCVDVCHTMHMLCVCMGDVCLLRESRVSWHPHTSDL